MDIPASSQIRVLVVDDDELNQRMMNLILTREGHQVHIAVNGLDAMRAVETQNFDIILMDLQMPMMDGVEASRRIRESGDGGKNAYIVALTASYLPERGQELFDAGIDNYIAKPFNVEHLRQMLEYGLDHYRFRNSIKPPIPNDITVPYGSNDFDTKTGILLVGGDEDTYRELLADFVDKLPEKNEMIDKYLAENDIKNLSRVAHNIKGVSSNLGALQLYEYADKLEKTINDGYTNELLESVVRDVKEVSRKFMMDASNFLASKRAIYPFHKILSIPGGTNAGIVDR
jgi:CheY-like chemotaxis protein/HPt (histidine-containing phosphotransfer) domain-containing protein